MPRWFLPDASTAGRTTLTAAPAGTRAMWLWGDDPAAEVVTWAAGKGVSEIFVYVSPSVLVNGDLARLQDMRRCARTLNIKMTALGSDSSWVTDHKAALAWQRTVVRTGVSPRRWRCRTAGTARSTRKARPA